MIKSMDCHILTFIFEFSLIIIKLSLIFKTILKSRPSVCRLGHNRQLCLFFHTRNSHRVHELRRGRLHSFSRFSFNSNRASKLKYFFLSNFESIKKMYSRVVRLCKYDQGIENIRIWRHFEKARLNCSIPGTSPGSAFSSNSYFASDSQYPFYFNEIQSVYFDKQKNLVYAIFSTPL